MALNFTTVDLTPRTGEAVGGYPVWPLAAFPFEAAIAKIYPTDMVSYVQPGRSGITASPLIARDCCSGSALWTAQTTNVTKSQDTGVLGNLPRWVFNGVGAGIYGTLPAVLTDYTIACLIRASNTTGTKVLFSVGPTQATRLMLYLNGRDVSLQHGIGDIKTSTGSVATANIWLPIIVSYKDATKALRIYTTSTTPLLSATMTNSPPSDVVASIGSGRTGVQPLAGEIAMNMIWSRPIHEDATALAQLVTAMTGLSVLT